MVIATCVVSLDNKGIYSQVKCLIKYTNLVIINIYSGRMTREVDGQQTQSVIGFAPIFPDTCYHLTHYWPAAADIPVASDNPVHYADAIRYNARTPLQGSLLPLTRLV